MKFIKLFSLCILTLIANMFFQYKLFAYSEVSIDNDFVTSGGFNSLVVKLVLQPDGKIIAGGNFTFYDTTPANRIVRLNPDGSIDNTFIVGAGLDDNLRALALQPDGKILVGGFFTSYSGTAVNRIVRLNPDGSIDNTFAMGSGFTDGPLPVVYAISVQPDGKILIGGSFMDYNGTPVHKIVRLNPDGAIDTSFNVSGIGFSTGTFDSIYRFALQPDGKILVGGDFDFYNGTPANRIIRLHPDGSIDTGFVTGLGVEDTPFPITLQDDGKILLGGNFITYNGVTVNSIVRLNSDGSIDTGFVTGLGFDSITRGIEIQDDGKILVLGAFTSYDGNIAPGIVLLHPDGSIDTGFVSGSGIAGGSVEALLVQPDGKILLGGTFTLYDGILANRIVRLNHIPTFTAPIITSPLSGSIFSGPVTFIGTGTSGNIITVFDGILNPIVTGIVDHLGNFSLGPVIISGGVYTAVASTIQGSFTGTSILLSPYVASIIPPIIPPSYGGGGSSLILDNCPQGDYSNSYYDKDCGLQQENTSAQILDENIYNSSIVNGYCYTRKKDLILQDVVGITLEFKKAFQFFLAYDITSFDTLQDFRVNSVLTREQASKFFGNFATNVLCRKPDTSLKISYLDLQTANSNLVSSITSAYQLGLMKGSENGKFRPKDVITKAEFNAVIVRMILKSYLPEDTGTRRYDEYNKVSTELGIISQGAGSESILRKNAALMLFRAYKDNIFSLQNIDQESFVLESREEFIK